MRITPTAGLAALCTLALAACATGRAAGPSWPVKGLIVYVSAELHPDVGQAGLPAAEGVVAGAPASPGGGDLRMQAGHTVAPYDTHLPACEPVEVRKASGGSLLVRWLSEGGHRSTLVGDWAKRVHRTKDDCRARVAARRLEAGAPARPTPEP